MNQLYYIFIILLLLFKIAYLVSVGYLYYIEHEDKTNTKIPLLEKHTERLFVISSAGIIFALLIDFGYSIASGNKTIKVEWHEQIIYFVSGLMGLFHLDWGLILYNESSN
jgi:hypothetical protein|tara:strand:- start:693 stop:1022 length:330 start_codon:yes stop_codon:yes gene_type:complete